MEKEFVPHQESFELKELGFDEPCFGKYLTSRQSDWKIYELILEMGMNEEFEDNRNIYLLEKACSAPTFSQAFRFFREKRGLWQIILQNTDKDWTYDILPIIGIIDYKLSDVFNTYEEAELACLRKLIEIVKEK
jgi:hypothetical protein